MAIFRNLCVRFGFIVKEISEEGILFSKGGARWFVPSPKVKFSLDQGG